MNLKTTTQNVLLLASQSKSRMRLLQEACIPFVTIEQQADESACDWNLSVEHVVTNIARHKMEQAIVPIGKEGQICFVLTADTLSTDSTGAIHGKPTSLEDAMDKIKRTRQGINTCTSAFCLEKKVFQNNLWHTQKRIEQYAQVRYQFMIPDNWIPKYLQQVDVLTMAGGVGIELYGNQFLKEVQGSYSAIVGLPLFELRQALEEIGFF